MIDTHFFYIVGYRVVNSNNEHNNNEGICVLCSGAVVVQSLKKGSYLDIPKVCYRRCKKTVDDRLN